MNKSMQPRLDAEALRRELTICLTVGQTQPVVELEGESEHPRSVTVDFPVPCEPRSQTAIRLSLTEALTVCGHRAQSNCQVFPE
jgi:hypothetical protein